MAIAQAELHPEKTPTLQLADNPHSEDLKKDAEEDMGFRSSHFPEDLDLPSVIPHREAISLLKTLFMDNIGALVSNIAFDLPPKIISWPFEDERPWARFL
ncbi:MAG: hypothetical protein H6799_03345 [Candidatus Nomurabacteria bacterium]|nr:MAG: hypothetical protein H6799_03345 [Candidatus Nomurabacteria bacterium]HRV75978.1 hypothetical protein [Candidatus Saccharimonadales bacterium]